MGSLFRTRFIKNEMKNVLEIELAVWVNADI
jgi:hypothetical protein